MAAEDGDYKGPSFGMHWMIVAGCIFGYATLVLLVPPSRATLSAASLLALAPIVLLGVWSLAAMRGASGRRRRQWRLLAIAAGALLVADAGSLAYEVFVDSAGAPHGSLIDGFYIFGYLALIPVVLLASEPFDVVGLRRTRATVDVTVVVVWVWTVTYVLLVPVLAHSAGTSVADFSIEVVDFVADIALAVYLLSFRHSGWRSHDVLLVAMFAMLGVADLGHVLASAAGLVAFSGWEVAVVDIAFMVAFSLGAAAPLYWRNRNVPRAVASLRTGLRAEFDLPHWPGVVAQILALALLPALFFVEPTAGADDPDRLILTIGIVSIAALIVVRSAIVSTENARMLEQNLVDPLSGLSNLRHYRETLDRLAEVTSPESAPVTLAIVDIEGLNAINATHGHGVGDAVIRSVAGELLEQAANPDTPCRIGGDVFAWVMPDTGIMDALAAATRLQVAVQPLGVDMGIPAIGLACGIASASDGRLDAELIDAQAQGALYWAKRNRRGDPVVYDPDVIDALDASEHLARVEDRARTSLIEVLATAVDARDPYTQSHSQNVAELVRAFGVQLGMDAAACELLYSAGILHDVGKIGVPDAILRKPAALSQDEFEIVQRHPGLGARILSASAHKEIVPWIRSHHERWDGAGYPDGLAGERIPLEARILCLADSFDAMLAQRPYRRALSFGAALAEVTSCAGSQFDPDLAHRFVEFARTRASTGAFDLD